MFTFTSSNSLYILSALWQTCDLTLREANISTFKLIASMADLYSESSTDFDQGKLSFRHLDDGYSIEKNYEGQLNKIRAVSSFFTFEQYLFCRDFAGGPLLSEAK